MPRSFSVTHAPSAPFTSGLLAARVHNLFPLQEREATMDVMTPLGKLARLLRVAAALSIASGLIVALPAQAQAQLRLPTLPLPAGRGLDTGAILRNSERPLESLPQPSRSLQIRELLRRHPDVIETDPLGEPIVRSEVLALSPSTETLAALGAAGFTVIRERGLEGLEGLDTRVVALRPPAGVAIAEALERLRALDPGGAYDFNHLYSESGAVTAPESVGTPLPAAATAASAHSSAMRIGLIDGGIDRTALALNDSTVVAWGCSGRNVPSAHGTAVASLMVGHAGRFRGAAPAAELYAADVYCDDATGGAVDTIVDALSWLARQQVPVINLSLVGPPNRMLERIIQALIGRGHLVVAAVGNDGPAAPPLYPASYAGVIGVSAVDARQHVLPEAARGPQVAFAAPGADMVAAAGGAPGYVLVRGTSFAAPLVAGLLATMLHKPDPPDAQRAVAELARSAVDLGSAGKDPIFGYGLVGMAIRVDPSRVP